MKRKRFQALSTVLRKSTLDRAKYPALAAVVLGRNVVNVPEIEDYVKGLSVGDPRIDGWLEKNLRKYLIRDYEKVSPVRSPEGNPDWVGKALDKGQQVFEVKLERPFEEKIEHVIDWMKSEDSPRRLDAVTVPEALKQANQWTEALKNKKVDEQIALSGEKILKKYPDGYTWRELTSREALDLEGKKMGHCVGSYADRVMGGGTKIWSLRDPKNEPHCTIEITRDDVRQIKGKQNGPVVEKYRSYVKDLVGDSDLMGDYAVNTPDLLKAGMIELEGTVYDIEEIKANPDLLKEVSEETLRYHKQELLEHAGLYVLGGKLHTQSQIEKSSDLMKALLANTLFNVPAEAEVRARENGGIEVGSKFPDVLLDFLPIGAKEVQELSGLLDYYDIDYGSIREEDLDYLYDALEKKRPKGYKKLMDLLNEVASKNEYEGRVTSGDFLYQYSDELQEIYDAVQSAISDGWQIGTQGRAYRYVKDLLSKYEWEYANTYKEGDMVWLSIQWEAIAREGYGYQSPESSRRPGFEYEFDEEAAQERFPEALYEHGFLKEEKKESKKPAKKKSAKPKAKKK